VDGAGRQSCIEPDSPTGSTRHCVDLDDPPPLMSSSVPINRNMCRSQLMEGKNMRPWMRILPRSGNSYGHTPFPATALGYRSPSKTHESSSP